jgi:hypothetical protein
LPDKKSESFVSDDNSYVLVAFSGVEVCPSYPHRSELDCRRALDRSQAIWFQQARSAQANTLPIPNDIIIMPLAKPFFSKGTTCAREISPIDYRLGRHWEFRLSCENLLNQAFAVGAQGVGPVDPSHPTTLTFSVRFAF